MASTKADARYDLPLTVNGHWDTRGGEQGTIAVQGVLRCLRKSSWNGHVQIPNAPMMKPIPNMDPGYPCEELPLLQEES